MKAKRKKQSLVTEGLLEMADDMHRIGIMGDADYDTIVMRHLGEKRIASTKLSSAKDIRNPRKRRR